MAKFYWIDGGGSYNWDAKVGSDYINWSNTSGGPTPTTVLPSTGDEIYFDAGSGDVNVTQPTSGPATITYFKYIEDTNYGDIGYLAMATVGLDSGGTAIVPNSNWHVDQTGVHSLNNGMSITWTFGVIAASIDVNGGTLNYTGSDIGFVNSVGGPSTISYYAGTISEFGGTNTNGLVLYATLITGDLSGSTLITAASAGKNLTAGNVSGSLIISTINDFACEDISGGNITVNTVSISGNMSGGTVNGNATISGGMSAGTVTGNASISGNLSGNSAIGTTSANHHTVGGTSSNTVVVHGTITVGDNIIRGTYWDAVTTGGQVTGGVFKSNIFWHSASTTVFNSFAPVNLANNIKIYAYNSVAFSKATQNTFTCGTGVICYKMKNGITTSKTGAGATSITLSDDLLPTGLTATNNLSDKVSLAWTAAPAATSYEVWRNTVDVSGSATKIASPVTNSYDDTTAVVGTTYYYWFKTVDTNATSDFSASAS
jgi:hypothetical protein